MGFFKEQEHWTNRVNNYLTDEIPKHLAWEQMAEKISGDIEAYEQSKKPRIGWLVLLSLLISSICIVSDNRENIIQNIAVEKQNLIIATHTEEKAHPTLNVQLEQTESRNQIDLRNEVVKSDDKIAVQVMKSAPKLTTVHSKNISPTIEVVSNFNTDKNEDFSAFMEIKRLSTIPIESLTVPNSISSTLNPSLLDPKSKKRLWQLSIGSSSIQFQPNYKSEEQNAVLPSLFEQNIASQQVYFRIHRKLSNHLEVSTGIQAQSLNYRVTFTRTDTVNLYRPMTIDTIFTNANTGEQRFVYRDSIPGLRTYALRQQNQVQTIQIPLLLGYEWRKNRVGLIINGGINTHLHFKSKGKIILNGKKVLDLTASQNTGMRLSALLEVQPTFHINEQIALFGQVGVEQHLINWMNEEYTLSQYPNVQYLGIGIRRQLGK